MIYFVKEGGFNLLLNPHGSDETIEDDITIPVHSIFLTHTVQMKPIQPFSALELEDFFLTHTVQMKQKQPSWYNKIDGNFLTHTVQMKRYLWLMLS